MKEADMEHSMPAFSVSGYFQVLARVMAEPRVFFTDLSKTVNIRIPFGFLLLSSAFFSLAANIVHQFPNPLVMTAILFTNALGMTAIAAALGYILVVVTAGRRCSFVQIASVYAYASGAVFLAAWIPMALGLTELWKWWLILTGLCRTCGLKRRQAWLVVALSIGAMILVFWAVLPIIE
jgi:hypothetical protein